MNCLMDHIVLNVENIESMIAFYSKVLMLDSERLEEYRNGTVPFPSVRLNPDTIIDLFPKNMWQNSSAAEAGHNNLKEEGICPVSVSTGTCPAMGCVWNRNFYLF